MKTRKPARRTSQSNRRSFLGHELPKTRRASFARSLRFEALEQRQLLTTVVGLHLDTGNLTIKDTDDGPPGGRIVGADETTIEDNNVTLSFVADGSTLVPPGPALPGMLVTDPGGVDAGTGANIFQISPTQAFVLLTGLTANLDIDLQGGDDNLTFANNFALVAAPASALTTVNIHGGDNSPQSDVLLLNATAGVAESVTIRPDLTIADQTQITGYAGVALNSRGFETVVYDGSGADDTLEVEPGQGDHAVRVDNGPQNFTDRVTADSLPTIDFRDLLTFRVDSGAAIGQSQITFVTGNLAGATNYETTGFATDDALIVEGSAGDNDSFTVTNPVAGEVLVAHAGGASVTATSAFGLLRLNTLGGNDTVTVDNTTGLVVVPIQYDGGVGSDELLLIGTTVVTTATYTPGATNDAGTVVHAVAGGPTQTVSFTGLEPVVDLVPAASLVVNGTNADNAINYSQGSVAANGLISVDGFETIEFSNKVALTINGLAGSDTINLNNQSATAPTGLTGITVNGGDPTGSDTLIVNGIAGVVNNFFVTPTGVGAGTVDDTNPNAIVPVAFTTIEHLTMVGQSADTDSLNLGGTAVDDTISLTPGPSIDSGTATGFNVGAGAFNFTPLTYTGFRRFLTFPEAPVAGGLDTLIVNGTDADDVFVYRDSIPFATDAIIQVNNSPEIFSRAQTWILRGLSGNDTFNVDFDPNSTNTSYTPDALRIEGGDSDPTSDKVNVTLAAGAQTATIEQDAVTPDEQDITFTGVASPPMHLAGVELVSFFGTGGDDTLTVNTGDGDNTVRVVRGNGVDRVTSDSLPAVEFGGVSTFTVVAGDGSDQVTFKTHDLAGATSYALSSGSADILIIEGEDGATGGAADNYTVTNPLGVAPVAVLDNNSGVTVTGGTLGLLGRLQINTLGHDDVVTVDAGIDGAIPTAITYDGGSGRDTLNVTGTPPGPDPFDSVTYTPGPSVDQGRLQYTGPGMLIDFVNLEPVVDTTAAASLVINGTNANNAINYTQGSVATNGLVSVDNFETYEFSNKTTLTINGLAGDDTINLNNPTTPTGLTGITVNGNDPTASDTVIVNVLTAATVNALTANSAVVTRAGEVTVTVATTELLKIVGDGSTNLTIQGTAAANTIVHTPGSGNDEGDVRVDNLLPVTYQALGAAAVFTIDGNGGAPDTLVARGTNSNDTFTVAAVTGNVTLNARIPIVRTALTNLTLDGLNGDDTFNVPGNHPYAGGILVSGGDPSASDVLNFTSSGGNVTVDFATSTVTEVGFSPVSFSGVETLNVNTGNADIFVLGTLNDDAFTVTPDVLVATTRLQFNNLTLNVNNLDQFFINGVSGDDTLTVNATATANTVDVTGTFVDITIPNRQRIDYLNIDALRVLGSAGSDTFNVTPAAATSIFVDGGDPIGVLPGDVLNIVGGGAATFQPGPEADEGGFSTLGNQPISFDHIESVAAVGPGGFILNGTNGNDVITIIARDASTHAGADGILDFTVSVNDGPSVLFLNTPVVTVNALAGDDIITVRAPAPNDAIWGVTVNIDGGEASPSVSGERDEVRIETPYLGDEVAVFVPTGLYSGIVVIGDLGTVIFLADVFAASYDGFQDGDDLVVATPNAVIEPGSDPGSGVIHPVDLAGNPMLDLTYRNVSGVGSSVTVSGTTAVVQGTDENDVITVDALGIVTVTNELGFSNTFDASQFDNLVINALGGDDQVTIAADAPFLTIDVLGGDNGDGSDELNYDGALGVGLITVETDLKTVTQAGQAVVSFDGIEDLNIDADGNSVDINGSLDDDSFIVRPNDATGAEVQQVGLNTVIQVNNTLDLEIDGDNGVGLENTLTIVATAGNDQITLNANQIAVAGRLPIQYSDIQALRIEGRAGTDRLTVDVSAGFPTNGGGNPIPITFDGQDGLDTLVISGVPTQPVDEVIYGPGPLANTGRVRYENAANTTLMTVDFVNLEPVIDLVVAANLTVNGTNADNAINYSLDNEIVNDVSIDTGLVSVDGFETIEFANKTNLNLNGLSGSDVINLGALGTPLLLTTVNVDGGDPTESDKLVVNGRFGGSTIDFAPTAGDTGAISVSALPITNYTRTESVTYVGRSGGDLLTVTSPVGGAEITYVPGATMDSGTVTQVGVAASSSLTPFEFRDLGVLSTVTFATVGGVRSSGLDIQGTNNDDAFNVNPLGHVQVVKANLPAPVTPTILTPGVAVLRLLGLNGDDIFNVPGAHPIPLGIFVEGGDPSASDVLNFTAAAAPVAAVSISLAASTITQTGFGPVGFSGIEILNAINNGQALSVTGTGADEDLTVTVASATSGTIELGYAVQQNGQVDQAVGLPVINYSGLPAIPLNALAIDLAGGEDTLVVVGNALNQTFDVNVPAGSVAIDDGPVVGNDGLVTFTNTESLSVFGLEGDDTFNVTPGLIPVFVDGGDPIGEKAPLGGDTINVVGAILFFPGPEVDEGGFVAAAAATVSFDHIENIGPIIGSPCVIILGTNGDDDITVIARDASYNVLANGIQDFTVSVNGGPDILYIDVTMLFIDALSGDDDIVLRTPAPNNAVWDVDVFIAGGPPSAVTGDQGDVFELETPFTQTVNYTPTGSDTGVIDIVTLSSVITLGSFVDACPPLLYDSSVGGVEEFVYDGEGGNDLFTIIGTALADVITHTPGLGNDEGSLRVNNLLGMTYQNLGLAATLTVNGGAGVVTDTLVVDGTQNNDTFTVATATGAVTVNARLPINQISIETLTLHGLNGDDTFNIPGGHPYTTINIEGGSPSASDVLFLTGAAATAETVIIAPDAVNPTEQDVTGLGGTINVSGTELIRYTGTPDVAGAPDDLLIVRPGAAGGNTLVTDDGALDRVISDTLPDIQFTGLLRFRVDAGNASSDVVTFQLGDLSGAVAANYELTTVDGADTLAILGHDGFNDNYLVTNPVGAPSVAVSEVQTVTALTSVGRLQINSLNGDDNVQVNVGGPGSDVIAVPITFDGGLGTDTLTTIGTPVTAVDEVIYSPGPAVTEGRLRYENAGNALLMLIDFLNLEPVFDLINALTLTVNGDNGNNAINYTQGGLAANGRVTVDAYEAIEFSNKTNLVINGLAGDDVTNINNPTTPAGLTGTITVNGNDPTASDTVIVNVLTAATVGTLTANSAVVTRTGEATVNVNTTELLKIVGDGTTNLTIQGTAAANTIVHTPGSGNDEGDVRVDNLLPVTYQALGAAAIFTIDGNGGATDTLVARGTNSNDTFTVAATSGNITLNARIPIVRAALTNLVLDGFDGDDTFNIPGNHPYTGGILVSGGNPSASDVLNYTAVAPAPAAAVALNLAASTITQVGFGPVGYTSVEVINLNANGQTLGVTATANDDDLTVTVFSATSGQIEIGYAVQQNGQVDQGVVAPLINYSGLPVPPAFPAAQTNALSVDLGAGEDTLIVVGNALTQTFVVNATGAPFDPPLPAPLPLVAPAFSVLIDDLNDGTNNGLVTYSNNESLAVFGLEGTDGFFVAGADGSVPVFVDGGDPIGIGAPQGDFISVTGAAAFFVGPEPDEGGFFTDGGAVSYDHIERIGPIIVIPGCPFLIVGTNADDDITVIARDASTHAGADGVQDFTVSVNAGPDLLLLNTPDLFIDALSGDDDIVIRAPAPNDVAWNVHVRVAGGPPSIGEPNDGDRLVLETPGLDSMFYTPTGPDTGSLLIDEGGAIGVFDNGDTLIEFGPFVFVCPPAEITYISSPGGVELVEYDGELPVVDFGPPIVFGPTATDNITINGTALNDTTTVAPFGVGPGGSGQGSFVSPASPLFNFRGFDALTVNGGAGGFDHVIYNATEGPDVITSDIGGGNISLLTTDVNLDLNIDKLTLSSFGGDDNINIDITVGLIAKTVDAGAGNDTVDLAGSDDADIFGGIGNDILIGTPAADNIFGGPGNDVLIGGGGVDHEYGEEGNDILGNPSAAGNGVADDPGNDFFFGGDGSDIFVWEPGDGNDTNEGGDGSSDVLTFIGSAAATDAFVLTAVGTRLRAERSPGAVVLDNADIEIVNLNGLALADDFTINDLYPTAVQVVNVDFGAADGAADDVIINGRDVSDEVNITPVAGVVEVTGLRYDVNVLNAVAANLDTFTFNGNNGNDNIVSPLDASLTAFFTSANFTLNGGLGDDFITGYGTLNGNEGNDTLLGGSEGQTINGGAGDDLIRGGGGVDALNGDAGEDTFLADFDGVLDTYNGGADFDTILIQATSGNDRIDAIQDNPTQIRFNVLGLGGGTGIIPGAGTQADALVAQTVEELEIQAGSGDDTIRVAHADSLVVAGVAADMLRFTVDGGAPGASDRLTVTDLGAGDTTVQRIGGIAGDGSFTMYSFLGGVPANGIIPLPPVNYTDVEFASLNPLSPITGGTGADGNGRLFVFKHDPYEQNNSRLNATFLGANETTNVDPTIDPGNDPGFGLPGDEDWYRIVAETNGTLDIQVYFDQQGTLTNGRAGLPSEGNLEIALYDVDGLIGAAPAPGAIAGLGTFGTNDTDDNERIRIPAVAGQTYYLRVVGSPFPIGNVENASAAINIYNVAVINTPAPVPFDLELDDRIVGHFPAEGVQVVALGTTTSFNSNLDGQFPDDFFNGKVVSFKFDTPTTPGIAGEESVVLDYVGATGVFTLSIPLSAAPAAGDTFQVESVDTGRNNNDNITRDTTPTIFLRVPDVVNVGGVANLDDLPYNGIAPGNPPDQFIGIPHISSVLLDVPALSAGFRVPIFVVENGTSNQNGTQVLAGYAQPVDPVNRPGLFSFTFGSAGSFITSLTPDGSYFISARVEMIDPAQNIEPNPPFGPDNQEQAQGYGDYAQSLEIFVDTVPPPVSFGDPGIIGDGLAPDSDSFVIPNPETIIDLVTNDLTPTFWGRAEADATVRLFADAFLDANGNGEFDFVDVDGDGVFEPGDGDFPLGGDLPPNGVFDPNTDVFIGQDTAIPLDGNQQEPNGFWKIESVVNFNDPRFFLEFGGLRTIFATAEDVAGNVNPADAAEAVELEIFIDVQGPQIIDVTVNAPSGSIDDVYDLFDPKPSTDGPTPLVNSIWLEIRDLPNRVVPGFEQPAFKCDIAENPGHYLVTGDYNGIFPILEVNACEFLDPAVDGQPATGRVQIVFRKEGPDGVFDTADDIGRALFDDRFTLFVSEDGIIDFAGNKLDGESNADEPHDSPPPTPDFPDVLGVDGVPTGDGIPGGDFIARFTVDSRPELAVWAGGSIWVDANGNNTYDSDALDFSNRDFAFVFGFATDEVFAGKFMSVNDPEDGNVRFDKTAAYGRVGTDRYRWLIDTDNDGVPDIEVEDPSDVIGHPVAGNFGPFAGDEVGLFTGSAWHFDTNHDFDVNATIAWPAEARGRGVVGDFDGDGRDDLAAWADDYFFVDLSSVGAAGPVAALNNPGLGTGVNGTIDVMFRFGFPGVSERPVAADMNMDGIEDLGLWVPARDGVTPGDEAEWYFLVSGLTANNTGGAGNPPIGDNIGPAITGSGDPGPGSYLIDTTPSYLAPGQAAIDYLAGRVVLDPLFPGSGLPSANIVRYDPTPFGNDLYMQFGDKFALPLLGNFDPPVSSIGNGNVATNPRHALDVNNDGYVTPLDALLVINHMNANDGTTAVPTSGFLSAPFLDVNGDNYVSPSDALDIINFMNLPAEGEGEAADSYFSELGEGEGESIDEDYLGLFAADQGRKKK